MKTIPLANGDMRATIAPEKGSNLCSFSYKNQELFYTDPKILENGGFTGCYVLFPTPNRVENFTYMWAGEHYILQKQGKPVDTHHQLVFDQPFKVLHASDDSLVTSISIDKQSHLYPGYPFPCTLTLEYKLYPNRIRIGYCVQNNATVEMPFGFGLHPHFKRLSGNDKTIISLVGNSLMHTKGDSLLPDGTLVPVSHMPTPVGQLNLDHVFTDIPKHAYASVRYSTLGFQIVLRTSEDFTHLVCWTGHPEAIAIENQTCSTDAINLYNRGYKQQSHVLLVPPHTSHSGWIEYTIQSYDEISHVSL